MLRRGFEKKEVKSKVKKVPSDSVQEDTSYNQCLSNPNNAWIAVQHSCLFVVVIFRHYSNKRSNVNELVFTFERSKWKIQSFAAKRRIFAAVFFTDFRILRRYFADERRERATTCNATILLGSWKGTNRENVRAKNATPRSILTNFRSVFVWLPFCPGKTLFWRHRRAKIRSSLIMVSLWSWIELY